MVHVVDGFQLGIALERDVVEAVVLTELDESVVAKSAAKIPPAPGLARVWLWRSAFLAVACAALAYYSRLMWRER